MMRMCSFWLLLMFEAISGRRARQARVKFLDHDSHTSASAVRRPVTWHRDVAAHSPGTTRWKEWLNLETPACSSQPFPPVSCRRRRMSSVWFALPYLLAGAAVLTLLVIQRPPVITCRELCFEGDVKLSEIFSIGDEVEAMLHGRDEEGGLPLTGDWHRCGPSLAGQNGPATEPGMATVDSWSGPCRLDRVMESQLKLMRWRSGASSAPSRSNAGRPLFAHAAIQLLRRRFLSPHSGAGHLRPAGLGVLTRDSADHPAAVRRDRAHEGSASGLRWCSPWRPIPPYSR